MARACVFCDIICGRTHCHEVYRTDRVLAFLDTNPLSPGHCLVVPQTHYASLSHVPPHIVADCGEACALLGPAVSSATAAFGFDVLVNDGAVASQTVPHVHFHVIPRTIGDGLGFRWGRGTAPDNAAAGPLAAGAAGGGCAACAAVSEAGQAPDPAPPPATPSDAALACLTPPPAPATAPPPPRAVPLRPSAPAEPAGPCALSPSTASHKPRGPDVLLSNESVVGLAHDAPAPHGPASSRRTHVIPRCHAPSLPALPPPQLRALFEACGRLATPPCNVIGGSGYPAEGGACPDHCHLRVITRRTGDGLGYRWRPLGPVPDAVDVAHRVRQRIADVALRTRGPLPYVPLGSGGLRLEAACSAFDQSGPFCGGKTFSSETSTPTAAGWLTAAVGWLRTTAISLRLMPSEETIGAPLCA